MQAPKPSTRKLALACLLLLVLPALLLFEALFLGNDFVPFDHRVFPPANAVFDAEQVQELRARGNWEITEKTMLVVPEFELAKQELAAGRLPHYNPWVRSGAPLFANVLDGFASPLHLPLFFGRVEARFALVAFIAFALAGLFMLGFLREVGVSLTAALFGAIVFQLSGTLAANAHFYMRMETLAWLPAGFWALERYAKTASLRAAVAFSFVVALTWLAGFPPYALVCCLAFGARIAWLSVAALRPHGLGGAARSALTLGAASLLGVGLAAIQVLPMLDYFPEGQRNLAQSLDELVNQGIDPLALFGFAMPTPFVSPIGHPDVPVDRHPLLHWFWSRTSPVSGKLYWPISFNYTEYAVTIGALPCVCVVVALFARRGFRFFGALLLALAFVLATGGPLFQVAVKALPTLASTPPLRFVGLCCFFAAALAGIGFEALVEQFGKLGRRATATLCIAASALTLAVALAFRGLADDPGQALNHTIEVLGAHWRSSYPEVANDAQKLSDWFGPYAEASYLRFANSLVVLALSLFAITMWIVSLPLVSQTLLRRRYAVLTALAIALTAAFRLGHAREINPSFAPPTPETSIEKNEVVAFLRQKREELRDAGGFTVARVAERASLALPLPPNLLVRERIRDLNSYAFVDANTHRPFLELYGPEQMVRQYWVQALPADERLRRGLFDLFGVRYFLTTQRFDVLGEPVLGFGEGSHASTYVYENEGCLARAWLVATAQQATTPEATLRRLVAEDFDPRRELHLHDVSSAVLAQQRQDAAVSDAKLRFVEDEPTSLRIAVEDSPGAWLVLADAVFSHWKASIDGQAADWHRANLMHRAIFVPKGSHEVAFRYDPQPFRYGAIASAIALLLAVVLLALGGRRLAAARAARRAHASPEPAHD